MKNSDRNGTLQIKKRNSTKQTYNGTNKYYKYQRNTKFLPSRLVNERDKDQHPSEYVKKKTLLLTHI